MQKVALKWQVVAFLLITFSISWFEEYLIQKTPGGIDNPGRDLLLMWTPGLVGLTLSWIFGWRFKDIGFRWPGWKNLAISYVVPVCVALFIFGALLLLRLGEFELNPKALEKFKSVQLTLFMALAVAPVIGTFFGFISGLGEEIGWRGFLHSKLIDLKIPFPYLLTGIIWAVWHWPLILFSNYATSDRPLVSLALFTASILPSSVFMGWMRQRSGSVYTAALTHGAHNLWIQAIYPTFLKKGPLDPYFGGEAGVFCVMAYWILAICVWRLQRKENRVP